MTKSRGRKLTYEQRVALAQRVKSARLDKGMTQTELASAAGISRQTVSNMERGDAAPQEAPLLRLMGILGIEILDDDLSEDTHMWMGLIGGVLEATPTERRGQAGKAALDAAASELASDVSGKRKGGLWQEDVDLAAIELNNWQDEQEKEQELP